MFSLLTDTWNFRSKPIELQPPRAHVIYWNTQKILGGHPSGAKGQFGNGTTPKTLLTILKSSSQAHSASAIGTSACPTVNQPGCSQIFLI